jgi:hypothetical protein
MSVVIGIDPHKGCHAAAAVDGEVAVAELEVKASKQQSRELLAWAERFGERRWAVESANGHGYLLVAAGEHVVDVPSTLASRVRVLDSTRSQKNDANDARSVAIVALHQAGLRRVVAEDHVAVLRMLAGRHRQLSRLKTQAASRLHAVLATLLAGGMSGELSSHKASRMLRRIRPQTMVETERKRIAHEHLTEVRRLEKEKKASVERLSVAVEASGTGLTDIFGSAWWWPDYSLDTPATSPDSQRDITMRRTTGLRPSKSPPAGRNGTVSTREATGCSTMRCM